MAIQRPMERDIYNVAMIALLWHILSIGRMQRLQQRCIQVSNMYGAHMSYQLCGAVFVCCFMVFCCDFHLGVFPYTSSPLHG